MAAYGTLGVRSWSPDRVPFQQTNNSRLAAYYARLIQDAFGDRPVTIGEFGGGCGKFAFLLLGELKRLGISHVRYLLTDASESNYFYWKKHPLLRQWMDDGILETSVLDPLSMTLPLADFWIANYFFDSIPHDLFKVEKGELFEGIATVQSGFEIAYSFRKAEGEPYPGFAEANRILEEYGSSFESLPFLFPIGALRTLKKIGNEAFVIAADRGPFAPDALAQSTLEFSRHGRAFSYPVNFEALSRFARLHGWKFFGKEGGALFSPIPLWEFDKVSFGPLETKAERFEEIFLRLEESNWDATLFFSYFDRIQEEFADAKDKCAWLSGMRRIEERFFPLFAEEGILLERLKVFLEKEAGQPYLGCRNRFEGLPMQGIESYFDDHPLSGAGLVVGQQEAAAKIASCGRTPWPGPIVGEFDTIYLFPPKVETVKPSPSFIREIEERFSLDHAVYSDADIEAFFALSGPAEGKVVLRFFTELERKKNITAAQLQGIATRLGMEVPEGDRFFETLALSLEKHLKPGGTLHAFLPGLKSYADARFYDQIVADPYLDVKETEGPGGVWLMVQKR